MADVPMLLGGRYEVGELLGRGGMAEVHLGFDSRLGRHVAIKMLRSDLARDQTFIARFRREAQSAAGLNHASIVAVYDHGEDSLIESGGAEVKVPFIVMEHVDGRTLREVLTERGSLPTTEALPHHRGRPRRPRLQPPQRDRPPRHQARERHDRRRRHHQGHGLRHRPRDGRRQRDDDPDPGRHRHGAVPLPRAGPGPARRRALRPVLHRLHALRAAHRPRARSPATARSPSPTSTWARRRSRRRGSPRTSPRTSTPSSSTPWPSRATPATRPPTSSAATSRPCASGGRSPTPPAGPPPPSPVPPPGVGSSPRAPPRRSPRCGEEPTSIYSAAPVPAYDPRHGSATDTFDRCGPPRRRRRPRPQPGRDGPAGDRGPRGARRPRLRALPVPRGARRRAGQRAARRRRPRAERRRQDRPGQAGLRGRARDERHGRGRRRHPAEPRRGRRR